MYMSAWHLGHYSHRHEDGLNRNVSVTLPPYSLFGRLHSAMAHKAIYCTVRKVVKKKKKGRKKSKSSGHLAQWLTVQSPFGVFQTAVSSLNWATLFPSNFLLERWQLKYFGPDHWHEKPRASPDFFRHAWSEPADEQYLSISISLSLSLTFK